MGRLLPVSRGCWINRPSCVSLTPIFLWVRGTWARRRKRIMLPLSLALGHRPNSLSYTYLQAGACTLNFRACSGMMASAVTPHHTRIGAPRVSSHLFATWYPGCSPTRCPIRHTELCWRDLPSVHQLLPKSQRAGEATALP